MLRTLPPSSGLRWTTRLLGLLAAAVVLSIAGSFLPSTAGTAHAAETGTIAVCLRSSTDTNLVLDGSGNNAFYQPANPPGSTNYVGAVGDSGCREQTVTADKGYNIWVTYRSTRSDTRVVSAAAGETTVVTFYTTAVTPHYSKSLGIGGTNGDSRFFDKPTEELLSDGVNEVRFRLDGTGGQSGRLGLLWPIAAGPGASYSATLLVVRLIDSNGNPLEGGTASAWRTSFTAAPGATGANGILAFALPGSTPVTAMRAYYNGTTQQISQNSNINSVYTFQTKGVSVQLRDADGEPLEGGSADYYAGGWKPAVLTDANNGEVIFQMLPGSYSFSMIYNGTREQKDNVNITTTNPVVFQTGRVTIHYSGTAQWYRTPNYYTFSGPEELLPGDVLVLLSGPKGRCDTPIAVTSGAKLELAAVYASLRTSTNQPLAGGVATAYVGGWKSVGTTNSAGLACGLFDVNGPLGNTSVRMVYNGSSQQITQNHSSNSQYLFQTTGVTVELRNSANELIDTGNASYYAGGWQNIGDTSDGKVTVALLPGSYSFAMTYNGTRQQINGEVISGSTDTVTFQTVGVDVELIASNGDPLAGGNPSYYAGGWKNLDATGADGVSETEMLPGSYSFAMTYNGTRQQLNGQVLALPEATVTFQTVAVDVKLIDSNGDPLAGGNPSYYAGGWKNLDDATGADGISDVEMLPGSYSFAMTYNGTRQQLNGQVLALPETTVTFQTGEVISDGTATAYYAGGWKSFTSPGQLLPGTYTFKFSSSPNQPVAVVAAETTSIP